MDQGLAAVWAGIAGLAGAGIGGAGAAWGAWIGGKKTVEAAIQAERSAATAEHQHWQRQQRYDAYRAVMALTEEMSRWTQPITVQMVIDISSRLRESLAGVEVLGPPDVSAAGGMLLAPLMDALIDFRAANPGAPGTAPVPNGTPVPWPTARSQQLMTGRTTFRNAVRTVLERPPT